MHVTVIGTGYAGLVTAACLAELGHTVTGFDIDEAKIASLREGILPIFEQGLDAVVSRTVSAGRLSFTTDAGPAVDGSDLVFLVVGTPSGDDGAIDTTHLFGAAEAIAPHISDRAVVVVKSTVPVGTSTRVAALLSEQTGRSVDVASNPEFLRQGSAVADFMEPDRIVVGSSNDRVRDLMRDLYRPLTDRGAPLVEVGVESAEIIKLAANAFLAVRLSFINEVADLCEATGADIADVVDGLGFDPRIGRAYLAAGPGFGGACLPKDTLGLVRAGEVSGTQSLVAHAAIEVNRRRPVRLVARIAGVLGKPMAGARIGVLGATFKAGTDDVRNSPSVPITAALIEAGAEVAIYDPVGLERAKEVLPPAARTVADVREAASGADALIVLTDWDEFRSIDFHDIASVMAGDVVADLRNVLDADKVRSAGLRYLSVGRPALD